MTRNIYVLLFMLISVFGYSQTESNTKIGKVKLQIQSAKEAGVEFQNTVLFQKLKPKQAATLKAQNAQVKDAVYFDFVKDAQFNQSVQNSSYITVEVPALDGQQNLKLDLVKVDIHSGDFITNVPNYIPGTHFRGVVRDSDGSLVAFSVYDDKVIGLISADREILTLGKVKGKASAHVLYNANSQGWDLPKECNTDDENLTFVPREIEHAALLLSPGDCIRQKFEIDESLTNQVGGVAQATDYGTGVFNIQMTLYANDGINVVLSELKVWSNSDPAPYNINGFNTLDSYRDLTDTYNGDVAYLGFYQPGFAGGVASAIGGICPSNVDDSKAIGGHFGFYEDFPVYSWDVSLISHEVGHLFGARHTHACVWNGNGTAIDGCAGFTEGGCPVPSNAPFSGTIMSYCSENDYNEGFHPQVATAIQNYIASRTCTNPCGPPSCTDGIQNGEETGVDCGGPDCPACPPDPTCFDGIQNGNETGIDCGGPDCPACPPPSCDYNQVTLTLTLDNYANETSWDISDSNGQVVASSNGTYPASQNGETVTEYACLMDDCYTFTIYDSYGDGICCAYGQGSYTLADDEGNVLASGGEFGFSESTQFCVEQSSCSDGIQNGEETGVDCGGPDCPACPPAPCDYNEVNLTLTFDFYASETSWDITNGNGGVVASSNGNYSSDYNGLTIVVPACLMDGCYTFTIYDSYGDGICCLYGEGSYSLTDANGNVLASGGEFEFIESTDFCVGATPEYCESFGMNTNYEWIERVVVGSFVNNSGDNSGYEDYTGLNIELQQGASANVELMPGFSFREYAEYWRVWIDYDHDGIFDASELAADGVSTGVLSGMINVPNSAMPGATRMRVSMQYNQYADACDIFQYGEVEDYTVTVMSSFNPSGTAENRTSKLSGVNKPTDLNIYPNPANEEATVTHLARNTGSTKLEIIDLTGVVVATQIEDTQKGRNLYKLNTSKLPSGVYMIRLSTEGSIVTNKLTIAK